MVSYGEWYSLMLGATLVLILIVVEDGLVLKKVNQIATINES